MTFSQLLELSASELEALTDEQLLEYLRPCLQDCPPVDIKKVQDFDNEEKLAKLAKKQEIKDAKKLERLISKTESVVERKTKAETKVTKKQLDQVTEMMDMLKRQMESKQKT